MRRECRFEFRLSELEAAKLAHLAEQKGVSSADVVRLLITNEYDVLELRKIHETIKSTRRSRR